MAIEDDRIGVGILGCSDIARRRFLPALARSSGVALAAVASRDLEKARGFAPGSAYAAVGYDELLRLDSVNLVYISLPNDLHEEWTLRALEQGKHVICEKPLGLSAASVDRVTAEAERRGLLLLENLAYLHHPQHAIVRNLIAEGAIGTVRMLRTAFGFSLATDANFRRSPERGGGAFHDIARYPLSAALFFLQGPPASFRGHALFRNGLNIAMQASAITAAGQRLQLSFGFDQHYECWYELAGDRGRIRVNRAYTTPADLGGTIELAQDRDSRTIAVPPHDHFTLMIDHACGLIRAGAGYDRARDDARRLARICDELARGCEEVRVGA